MSSDPSESNGAFVRELVSELLRCKKAGDSEGVARIQRELRDAMSRPVLPSSTIRRVPFYKLS
jgi:hypothetical protein